MINWHKFWQNYRPITKTNTDDFLYQVGKTVLGVAISNEQFNSIVNDVIVGLNLNKQDNLLDLCCGNGILTKQFGKHVDNIVGIDFSKMFIENALKYNKLENIKYYCSDIMKIEKEVEDMKFSKILIYDALASFNTEMVELLFVNLKKYLKPNGVIMLGAVLDNENKFKFYNTLRRKLYYYLYIKFLRKDNGIGYWWNKKEIIKYAEQNGYSYKFLKQSNNIHTAHYRFDIILRKND